MEGIVLHFDVSGSSGLIKDNDGRRYEFSASEWKSESTPSAGMHADFVVVDSSATQIYELPSPPTKEASSLGTAAESPLVWPDQMPPATNPHPASPHEEETGAEPAKAKPETFYGSRKMNWTGVLATVAVMVTLYYLPLLYSDFYGSVTPLRMTPDPFSLTYWVNLSIILLLVLILIFFYGGARKVTIRALTVLAIAGIGFHYFDAFQRLAIVWEGEPLAVTLAGGAYLNIAACGLMLLAAFSKHYSRLGAVSSGTSVVRGCIDVTGSYKNLPGGFEYSHLTLSDDAGENYKVKRVVVPDELAVLVSPGVCGTFVFTKSLYWKNLKGVKTENHEIHDPPRNVAFTMLMSLLGVGFMAFLTYGSIISVILIPFTPVFAIAALMFAMNILFAPFKARHIRRTLKTSGFSLTKAKEI